MMGKGLAIGYRNRMTERATKGAAPDPPRASRRNSAASRAAIEAAARQLFATRGYALTGVRDIASLAGVNSALVGRYFGTKEKLFRTIVGNTLDMRPVLEGPRSGFGEHVATIFEEARSIPSPLAMMLLSMADAGAREVARDLLDSAIVAPLAEWLGPPDARIRARQLNMLWSGYLTHSQLLPNGPPDTGELKNWLAVATQTIVDRA